MSRPGRRHPARVVVLGGGFAGLYATSYLARADLPEGSLEVTLISDQNYFAFLPLLPEVAGGALGQEEVAFPLRAHARRLGFRFLRGRVQAVEPGARRVRTSAGDVAYDFLVIALGARTNFFGDEELARRSLPLTSVQDALRLRQELLRVAEKAAQEPDPVQRRRLLSFAVAGAGPSGVEAASEIQRLLARVLRRDHGLREPARVTLVDGGDRILRGWDGRLAEAGRAVLEQRGIDVRLRTRVQGFAAGRVRLTRPDGAEYSLPARALVWTAGTRPGTAELEGDGLAVLESGHLAVDANLCVVGQERILAAGDNVRLPDPRRGRPYPAVAPIAISQGIRVAANVENAVAGRELEPYQAYHAGKIVSLGGGQALVDILGWHAAGRPAWLVYRAATLLQLVGARNKLRTLASLLINRLFEPPDVLD